VRPAYYSVADEIRATLVRILAYMGGLAVLAVAMASFFQSVPALIVAAPGPVPQPAAQAAAQTPARPIWRTVERPYPAFELLLPEFTSAPAAYAIQRRPSDGARKDLLSWGDVAAPGPFAMVEIFRPGPAGERFLDAESEIAARIVDYAVTDDVKSAGRVESKFGPVALVDFAMAPEMAPQQAPAEEPQGQIQGVSQDASPPALPTAPPIRFLAPHAAADARHCLGFAHAFANPALQIAGWYCSPGAEIVDRATVACMLDRITIVVADTALDAFFARAELKRTFCGQRSPLLAATPGHEPGLAQPVSLSLKSLKLRGRLSAR
jgi:hypothetical protein